MIDFRILSSSRRWADPIGSPFHQWTLPDGSPWTQFFRSRGGYSLRFPDLADFEISADGTQVVCYPQEGISEATPLHLYLNQVLPLVLGRMGQLVFHGSAVAVAGKAIGFVAESGRGKSTLAASFAVSGYQFLTDDGLVLDEKNGGYVVRPSHPSVRLWEDSERAIIPPNATPEPALHFTTKSRFLAGDAIAFCDQPLPLQRVYFLSNDGADAVTIEPLSASAALLEWIKHSFLLDIEDKALLATHFDRVAKLAQLPICYRLDYPRRYEALATVREAIIEHANTES